MTPAMTPAPRVVADGLRFPEGPTLLPDGSIAVVEMQGEAVSVVAPDGTSHVLGDCGGGPNGSVLGSDGAVYVANNGGLSAKGTGYWRAPRQLPGCVQRVDPSGEVRTVSAPLPGPTPHRPNDLCFGPDGTLYVTDSANWEELRSIAPGRLVAVAPDGSARQVLEIPAMPNGLAFAPDGRRLYIAQSLTRRILAVDISPDGQLGEPATLLKLPSGMPDGLCVAADGTLYVCGSVGNVIFSFSPSGELRRTIETGDGTQPTNCCIGSDGALCVTFSVAGQLVAFDLDLVAAPLFSGAVAGSAQEVGS
jgi:gluconolactonase